MTAVEFLAERYNYISWMRNRDEISAGKADEWRAESLKEAKEMEEQNGINSDEYTRGYKDGWRDCCKDVKEFG